MDDDVTDFIGLYSLRRFLKLPDSEEDEDSLRSILLDSCQEIDNVLHPFATSTPIPRGDPLFAKGKKLVVAYFRIQWAIEQRQFSLVKEYQEIYNSKKEALVKTLNADKTSRTESILVAAQPHPNRLVIPSQRDTFILD